MLGVLLGNVLVIKDGFEVGLELGSILGPLDGKFVGCDDSGGFLGVG